MGVADRSDLKREDVLQAVILAETFCTEFQPLTESVPFVSVYLEIENFADVWESPPGTTPYCLNNIVR